VRSDRDSFLRLFPHTHTHTHRFYTFVVLGELLTWTVCQNHICLISSDILD